MWEAFFVCTSIRFGGFWAEAWCRALANAQPSTGRLGWAVQIGNLLGGFSLTKAPSCESCKQLSQFTRKGASNDKVFRTLRRATKGFAFGNHSLLKKAGENFILQKLGAAR